jgi:hypothetical protein
VRLLQSPIAQRKSRNHTQRSLNYLDHEPLRPEQHKQRCYMLQSIKKTSLLIVHNLLNSAQNKFHLMIAQVVHLNHKTKTNFPFLLECFLITTSSPTQTRINDTQYVAATAFVTARQPCPNYQRTFHLFIRTEFFKIERR